MTGNINWKKIPPNARVTDKGTHYTYRGKLVDWSSFDAVAAQLALSQMSKRYVKPRRKR